MTELSPPGTDGLNGYGFRIASVNDIPRIVELLLDDPLGVLRQAPADDPRYEAAFRQVEADPNNELIVAERDGEVVGCLQLTLIPGLTRSGATRAQVEGVRVAASERGRGLGSVMMKFTEERALAKGAELIQLTTDNTRDAAHRFYERLGYTHTHIGMKKALA